MISEAPTAVTVTVSGVVPPISAVSPAEILAVLATPTVCGRGLAVTAAVRTVANFICWITLAILTVSELAPPITAVLPAEIPAKLATPTA